MVRYKIQVDTLNEVLDLIRKMSSSETPIYLTNADRSQILGARSVISELTALNWDEVWVESEDDNLYAVIKDVVV